MDAASLGLLLLLAGIALVALGSVASSGRGKTEVKGGAVVMIGPIPIVLGSDARWASVAIMLALILMLVTIFLYFRV